MARWTSEEFKQHQAGNGKKRRRRKPKGKGANQITSEVLEMLNGAGRSFAWRNNTTGIFDKKIALAMLRKRLPHLSEADLKAISSILSASYRKHNGIVGQCDVLGLDRLSGTFIGFEVKASGDTLRPEQEDFIRNVIQSRGFATAVGSASEAYDLLEGFRKRSRK